jgi:hypoxanthine phosphoribosyltransferase
MTTKKQLIELHDRNIRAYVQKIIRQLGDWRPDYVVGITRGGLIPAVMISQYLDVPMHTLNISFRDSEGGPESNLWMAEDAFGYIPKEERTDAEFEISGLPVQGDTSDPKKRKKILIVDDINDSGQTLNWIKEDWPSGCLPSDPVWEDIWNNTVRFAVIVDNEASEFKDVDYSGLTINKHEEPSWVVFPWETWWEN